MLVAVVVVAWPDQITETATTLMISDHHHKQGWSQGQVMTV